MTISLRHAWLLLGALIATPAFYVSPAAAASPFACTWVQATLTLNCSGSATTSSLPASLSSTTLWSTSQPLPIVIYDASATTFTPQNGSNSYTLQNSGYTGGWNPNPPTVTLNFDNTVSINVVNPGSGQLADKGLISANFSNTESVDGNGVNNIVLNNAGSIALTTNQISTTRMEVINSDSQVNIFTVNNYGTLSITQNCWVTTTCGTATFNAAELSVTSSGSPATYSAKYSNSTLNDMAALYSDDNTNEFVLNNAAGASVLATGNYATAYYGRADATITNYGTIANTSWTSTDTIANGHWAIVSWAGADYNVAPNTNPDSTIIIPPSSGNYAPLLGTSALTLTNYGTIKGDIIAMDITPLVYAAAVGSSSDPFPDPSSTTLLPYTVSNSNAGPRDSNIENYGTITGNFYLGSGTHVIDNAAGASITGSVYVDQRPFQAVFTEVNEVTPGVAGLYVNNVGGTDNNGTPCGSASTTTDAGCATTSKNTLEVVGGQSLTLTNEGTWTGDINIFDQASSVNSVTLTGSGFTGNVVAVNGTGKNTLTLNGVTNLASVYQFSTLNLGTSQVTVTPNSTTNTSQEGVTLVSGATLTTTIASQSQFGSLNFVGGNSGNSLNLLGPTTIVPIVTGIVHNGESFQFANSISGAGENEITVQNTSALVTFTDPSGVLTTSVTSPYQVPGISNAGATTLTSLLSYSGSNAALQALGAAVENLTTLDQVRNAGEQLRPNVNGASIQVPIDIAYLFQSQIDTRMESMMYGALARDAGWYADAEIRQPAVVDNGAWINAIDAEVTQQTRDNVSGYDAQSGGLIAGYDHLFNNTFRLGGAFGYATSSINDSVLTGNHQGLQTYEGIAYGSFVQPKWYVDASAGIGALDYSSKRSITFPGFSDVAYGSYKGMLYTARLDGGYPVRLPVGVIVPVAGVSYAHVEQDAYAETSFAGAALSIAQQNTDSVRSGLGLKAIFPVSVGPLFAVSIEPHAVWLHEFENTAQIVSAGFVGGTGSFLAIGPTPTRDMGDLGAALRFSLPNSGESLALTYNAIVREGYVDQVAMLRARVDF